MAAILPSAEGVGDDINRVEYLNEKIYSTSATKPVPHVFQPEFPRLYFHRLADDVLKHGVIKDLLKHLDNEREFAWNFLEFSVIFERKIDFQRNWWGSMGMTVMIAREKEKVSLSF
ncbi:uncharacterized protein [Fopius arisanus]|uniref:P protein n=1 Tax=Fopius arisanus TaxID=64838 RepID=A0A0C9PT37_9HYME|nr:PREDICTED: uncharacterized protein LOC105270577 [Fopius arisanus]